MLLEPKLTGARYFEISKIIFWSSDFFLKKYVHINNNVYFNGAIS
jgi:hypothetical protein